MDGLGLKRIEHRGLGLLWTAKSPPKITMPIRYPMAHPEQLLRRQSSEMEELVSSEVSESFSLAA